MSTNRSPKLAPRRFRIEAAAKSSGKPDTWDSADVTVFDGDTPVGRYERNYIGWAGCTFDPFEIGGRWFALYAPHYTGTRLMSLPDCRDIGGETPAENGFCPVEFWTPRFKAVRWTGLSSGSQGESLEFETEPEAHREGVVEEGEGRWRQRSEYGPWTCLDVAFVAGCIWGEDSTWKVQVIDLAHAAEGVISRSESFGYLQMPVGMSLPEAISLSSDWRGDLRATVLEQRDWNVRTGALIDPFE